MFQRSCQFENIFSVPLLVFLCSLLSAVDGCMPIFFPSVCCQWNSNVMYAHTHCIRILMMVLCLRNPKRKFLLEIYIFDLMVVSIKGYFGIFLKSFQIIVFYIYFVQDEWVSAKHKYRIALRLHICVDVCSWRYSIYTTLEHLFDAPLCSDVKSIVTMIETPGWWGDEDSNENSKNK